MENWFSSFTGHEATLSTPEGVGKEQCLPQRPFPNGVNNLFKLFLRFGASQRMSDAL
jgi:hypothetical protein